MLLSTLRTDQPTLAALAYYAQVPLGTCQGNPGSCYCTLVGGTDLFGGINAAGGGWVLNTDPNDVLEACIFPDLSSIDSWGPRLSFGRHHSPAVSLAHAEYKNPDNEAKGASQARPAFLIDSVPCGFPRGAARAERRHRPGIRSNTVTPSGTTTQGAFSHPKIAMVGLNRDGSSSEPA